jgi:hypothetical protein
MRSLAEVQTEYGGIARKIEALDRAAAEVQQIHEAKMKEMNMEKAMLIRRKLQLEGALELLSEEAKP